MATGAPALMTTTVCGLAAATAAISSSCADGRLRLSRSVASDSVSSETTTTAVLAALAAADRRGQPGRQRGRRAPGQRGRRPGDPERVGLARGQVHRHRVRVHRGSARVVDDLLAVQGQVGGRVAATVVGDGQHVGAGLGCGQRPGVAAAERGRRVRGGQVRRRDGRQRGVGGQALGVADRGAGSGRGLQALQRGDRGRREHGRAAAATVGRRGRRGRADHGHGPAVTGRERQHRAGVLQQRGPGLGHVRADGLVRGGGHGGRVVPVGGLLNRLKRNISVRIRCTIVFSVDRGIVPFCDRGLQRGAEEVAERLLLVGAVGCAVDVVQRAVVRGHEAGEVPGVARASWFSRNLLLQAKLPLIAA